MLKTIVIVLLLVETAFGESHVDWSRNLKLIENASDLKLSTGTAARRNSRVKPAAPEEPTVELRSLATQAQNTVMQLQRVNSQLSAIALDLNGISGTLNETLRPTENSTSLPNPSVEVPLVNNILVDTIVTLKNDVKAEMREAVGILADVLRSLKDDIVLIIVQQGAQISERITKLNCNCPNSNNNSLNYYRPPALNTSSTQVTSMHVY